MQFYIEITFFLPPSTIFFFLQEITQLAEDMHVMAGAKLLTFEAGIVRSPPLVFERKKVTIEGKELEVLDIQDSDFPSLFAEYLF